jgi:hypothetical protein
MRHMPSPSAFPDLAAVQRERGRLLAEREQHANALRAHMRQMQSPGFRRRVMRDALAGVWHTIRPTSHLSSAFGPARLVLGTLASAALGPRVGSPLAKAAIGGLSMVLPALWDGLRRGKHGSHLFSELGRSWQRIRDRLHQHREAHRG